MGNNERASVVIGKRRLTLRRTRYWDGTACIVALDSDGRICENISAPVESIPGRDLTFVDEPHLPHGTLQALVDAGLVIDEGVVKIDRGLRYPLVRLTDIMPRLGDK